MTPELGPGSSLMCKGIVGREIQAPKCTEVITYVLIEAECPLTVSGWEKLGNGKSFNHSCLLISF